MSKGIDADDVPILGCGVGWSSTGVEWSVVESSGEGCVEQVEGGRAVCDDCCLHVLRPRVEQQSVHLAETVGELHHVSHHQFLIEIRL